MGWAICIRWLWLQNTEPNRLWSIFPIHVHHCVQAFFSKAIGTKVGYCAHTLVWKEIWLHGHIISLAHYLFALVAKRRANKQTILEALTDNASIADMQGALTVGVSAGYLDLWDLILRLCCCSLLVCRINMFDAYLL